ncbi:FIST signal transduction protein [Rheinheimera sp. UJ63]|uniref:FIST signal transduction protein n=1 Tax=Rheinheimera sp. UJ63 TaxID=2910157 RepID=UPI001F489225|nr:FIST N-terminal domain-containing protein [Rheinheimera sp. UJ63]MCF4010268.1 FIST C-terminal domain-containing protein [Rheinheimera sp. UJ63]
MFAGIAFSQTNAAFAAGQQLAREAIAQTGRSAAQLLLLFCTAKTDYQRLLDGARLVCGTDTIILGGSAAGIISHDQIMIEGAPAAALAIVSDNDNITFSRACSQLIAQNPFLAGQQLGAKLQQVVSPALLLLFFDSVRYAGNLQNPAVLNASRPILNGLYNTLPIKVPIAGAGLLADQEFSSTKLFYDSQVQSQLATALLISGHVKPYISNMHGCSPLSAERFTITKIFEQFLYQLNDEPVTQVIDRVTGSSDWRRQTPVTELALGFNGATSGKPDYSSSYVTRLINGILPNDEGIILFEPDFREGMQIQIMQRDPQHIVAQTAKQTRALLTQIKQDQHTPIVALYFDCAGRIATPQEARELQQQLTAAKIPLLGIYTGVEIAPIGNKSRSLDWSGVLVILTTPN